MVLKFGDFYFKRIISYLHIATQCSPKQIKVRERGLSWNTFNDLMNYSNIDIYKIKKKVENCKTAIDVQDTMGCKNHLALINLISLKEPFSRNHKEHKNGHLNVVSLVFNCVLPI